MCLFCSSSAPLNNTQVNNTYRFYILRFFCGSLASFLPEKEKACSFLQPCSFFFQFIVLQLFLQHLCLWFHFLYCFLYFSVHLGLFPLSIPLLSQYLTLVLYKLIEHFFSHIPVPWWNTCLKWCTKGALWWAWKIHPGTEECWRSSRSKLCKNIF